jgi:hypothetical protein
MRVLFLNFGMRTNILSLIDSIDSVPCAMLKTSRVTSHHTHPSFCEIRMLDNYQAMVLSKATYGVTGVKDMGIGC